MKNSENTQIETLLNGLFDLNDHNGNEGAINTLELIYMGFVSSLEFEDMDGRDRANITFFFMKLKKLIENSKGLSKEDIVDLKQANNKIMKNVTIITGKQASGKTIKAKEIVANKKAVFLQEFNICSDYQYSKILKDTEVIVIDGLGLREKQEIIKLISSDTILVNKKNEVPFKMERPELILVSNSLDKKDFTEFPFVKFIEM